MSTLTTLFRVATVFCLFAALGCSSQNIELADVPADATEKVLKAQAKPPTKPFVPPENQISKGQPY